MRQEKRQRVNTASPKSVMALVTLPSVALSSMAAKELESFKTVYLREENLRVCVDHNAHQGSLRHLPRDPAVQQKSRDRTAGS